MLDYLVTVDTLAGVAQLDEAARAERVALAAVVVRVHRSLGLSVPHRLARVAARAAEALERWCDVAAHLSLARAIDRYHRLRRTSNVLVSARLFRLDRVDRRSLSHLNLLIAFRSGDQEDHHLDLHHHLIA